MEQTLSRIVGLLFSVFMAAIAALALGYIAHYDFGFSSLDIRKSALIGAAIVALLSAAESFQKNLRKPK
jgi:hypothetical protein